MEDENINYEISDYLKRYINSNFQKVRKYGIALLEPMCKTEREAITVYLKDIPDISSFSIGESGVDQKQVVLRHRPHIDEIINFSDIRKMADDAYKAGNYDDCINLYRKILAFSRIKEVTFARIGLAYMRKKKLDIAIDYLTVAMEVAKKNEKYVKDGSYDFSSIIEELRTKMDVKTFKPYFEMNVDEFSGNFDIYPELLASKEIYNFILDGYITFEEACSKFHLSSDNKNQIYLLCARDYYSCDQNNLGDKYLKKVEKCNDKSQATKKLLNEVRKNKKIYKNRRKDIIKQLIKI